jgi:hypothetical protein
MRESEKSGSRLNNEPFRSLRALTNTVYFYGYKIRDDGMGGMGAGTITRRGL